MGLWNMCGFAASKLKHIEIVECWKGGESVAFLIEKCLFEIVEVVVVVEKTF